MKSLEYSQIARRKIKALRARLTMEYGVTVSSRIVKQIIDTIRGLEIFEEKEDFMYKLFGITTTTQDTDDYWDE